MPVVFGYAIDDRRYFLGLHAWGVLFILASIWSSSFYLQAIALQQGLSVLNVVFWRVLIGGVTFWAICGLRGYRLHWRKRWVPYGVLGAILNTIPFSLIVFGQQYIDSGSTALVNTSPPFFALFLAHFFSNERFSWRKLLGISLGATGVGLLLSFNGTPSQTAPGDTQAFDLVLGGGAVLLAGFLYALGGVYSKSLRIQPPSTLIAGMLCMGAGWTGLLMLISQTPIQLPANAVAWGAVLVLGVVCTAIAYMLYFTLLAMVGVVNLFLVTLLIPIGANILGVWLLGENFGVHKYASLLLVLLGLVVVDGRALGWFSRQNHP